MTLRQFPLSVLISGGFCFVAGLFLLQAIILPPRMPDWDHLNAANGMDLASTPRTAAAALPDQLLYAVIAARPLFSETRRPMPGSSALPPGDVPAPAIDFTLAGVVAAPDQRLAIVSVARNGTTSVLRLGSVFEGWKVIDIQQTSISVQSETTTITLKITR